MNAPTFFPPVRGAGNAWTKRRSDDDVLQVWRAVANAGPLGINATNLRDQLSGMGTDEVAYHLQELRRKGHARFVPGANNNTKLGTWVATHATWPGEELPAWLKDLQEEDGLAPAPGAAEATLAQARAVPSSVFALGLKIAAEVDIDAVHRKADATEPAADSQAQPKAADTSTASEAAADPATPAPSAAEAGEPAAAVAETRSPPPTMTAAASLATADPIVVALDSLGRLLVHEAPDSPVVLSPTATRALFTYLDRTLLGDPTAGTLTDALP